MMPRQKMIGQSGEYLVCAELSEKELNCVPVNESCAYDVILDYGRLAKIQVKTSNYSPSECSIKFAISRRNTTNRLYKKRDADLFALVWLDKKKIAWFPFEECVGWKKSVRKNKFDDFTLERALSIIESNKAARNKDIEKEG